MIRIRRTPLLSVKQTCPLWTTPALPHVLGCGKGLWIPAAARKTGVGLVLPCLWTTPALPHVLGCGKGLWIPAAARKTGVGLCSHACGPLPHCPTYLDVGKGSGFPLRRERRGWGCAPMLVDHFRIAPRTWMWERALDSRCGEKDGGGVVLPSLLLLAAVKRTFRTHQSQFLMRLPCTLRVTVQT